MVFGKVKKWLGIEGVKVELNTAEDLFKADELVTGDIKFTTMNTQQILGIKIRMYERYTRGRGKTSKSDEYLLGEILLDETFMVYPEEEKVINFKMPFKLEKSAMDRMQDKGGLSGFFASVAKKSKGIQSEFRLEAEAEVAGTALNPFDKHIIVWKG